MSRHLVAVPSEGEIIHAALEQAFFVVTAEMVIAGTLIHDLGTDTYMPVESATPEFRAAAAKSYSQFLRDRDAANV